MPMTCSTVPGLQVRQWQHCQGPSVFQLLQYLTKPSAVSYPRMLRLQRLAMVEVVVAIAGVADSGEEVAVAKEEEEAKEVIVALEETKTKIKEVKTKVREVDRAILAIGPHATLISLHSSPAFAIGPLEKVLISVWSQVPVPGRTPGSPRPTNETSTSSTINMTIKSFMIYYTVTNYQKYIH